MYILDMNIEPEKPIIGLVQALAHIESIRAELHTYGNNDNEFYELDKIKEAVEKGTILPIEGIARANQIFDRKMER